MESGPLFTSPWKVPQVLTRVGLREKNVVSASFFSYGLVVKELSLD